MRACTRDGVCSVSGSVVVISSSAALFTKLFAGLMSRFSARFLRFGLFRYVLVSWLVLSSTILTH